MKDEKDLNVNDTSGKHSFSSFVEVKLGDEVTEELPSEQVTEQEVEDSEAKVVGVVPIVEVGVDTQSTDANGVNTTKEETEVAPVLPVEVVATEIVDPEKLKKEKKEKIKRRGIIGFLLCVIVLLIILLLRGCFGGVAEKGKDSINRTGIDLGELDLSNAKEIEMRLQQELDKNYVNYKINVNPVFADGKSEGNVMIQNSKENNGILQVEFILEDSDGQSVYLSPHLFPNESIHNAKLDVELPAGEHKAIAYFRTYSKETYEETQELKMTGEMGFKINLIIKN
jgi:hypothetical protein